MTEKEIEKEHSQEELKPDIHQEKSNEVHQENPSEPTPEPEPRTNEDNGNGEVTLRDVVDVLKKGFSEISGKLDTLSDELDSIQGTLNRINSSIGMLRGEISEWALLDTIVDYLKEHEKEKEFIIRKTPKDYKKVADWLLETEKRYYIIETKTYLDDKILKKAISQIGKEAQRLPDNKETWGIVASRFSEIRPGVLLFKFGPRGSRRTIPIYVFSYDIGAEKFRFSDRGKGNH